MNRGSILFIILCSTIIVRAQNTLKIIVKDQNSGVPLIGAMGFFPSLSIGGTTDYDGILILTDLPHGTYSLRISYIGYETKNIELTLPLSNSVEIETIFLSVLQEEMDGIIVSSTRSTRTIQDTPTRVEFIAGEELSEKGNMKPGDIRMLLNESTGIRTQQTSATKVIIQVSEFRVLMVNILSFLGTDSLCTEVTPED